MSFYNRSNHRGTPDAGAAARPADTTAPDPRLASFKAYLDALDQKTWGAGRAATQRLRSMGLSVVAIKPSDDRRPA
jgi:uncharacterized protein YciW